MLPCMSRRVAPTLNATGPKKEASFCKKPCLASMDPLCVCVCMLALVVAVLIAYDFECARKLSASLFLGSQKQAFLASWLWALIVHGNVNQINQNDLKKVIQLEGNKAEKLYSRNTGF